MFIDLKFSPYTMYEVLGLGSMDIYQKQSGASYRVGHLVSRM